MNFDAKKIGVVVGVLLVIGVLAFLILRLFSGGGAVQPSTGGTFGTTEGVTSQVPIGVSGGGASELPTFTSSSSGGRAAPIFKIADEPAVGVTLIETSRPTTTIARYVTGGDGHVLEVPLDVPGAAARIISNTTIPGIARAVWTEQGNGVIVQYQSSGILKSAHIALPLAASSQQGAALPAASIRFLLDNLVDVAAAPGGASIVFVVRNASGGVDGYTANTDGGNAKKLFSLPVSHVVLSWPSPNTIFLYSKSASGVPGIAFLVQTKTGAVTPTLYGLGLTATADPTGSYLLYRTDDGTRATLFAMRLPSGNTSPVGTLSPLSAALPEQCGWFSEQGKATSTVRAYCAATIGGLPAGFLDLWHIGAVSFPDTLVSLDPVSGALTPIATPGTRDGGETSDIINISISEDGRYLAFISKDDQAVWGVRLK